MIQKRKRWEFNIHDSTEAYGGNFVKLRLSRLYYAIRVYLFVLLDYVLV